MSIWVNGAERPRDPDTTVEVLVRELSDSDRGIAVAVNGDVVPRSRWPDTGLQDGDRVEVLGAAQGG